MGLIKYLTVTGLPFFFQVVILQSYTSEICFSFLKNLNF